MVRIANDTAGGGDRETVFVQSLQRGLAVIRAFDADNAALTLGDVAKSTNLARAAARRFVLTLVELGYVRVDGRLFRLSPRVLELGRPYLSSLTLPEIARPHQRAFVDAVRESSSLAILDDTDIVYVSHVAADRIMAVVVAVGTRDPAVTTSLGRVLLAGQSQEWLRAFLAAHQLAHRTERTIVDPERLLDELVRIGEQGYALVDQELEEGLRALAVPLRDGSGQVVAAVNVAVHASRWSLDAIRGELLPRLQEMAAEIDRDAVEAAARVTPPIAAPRRDPAPEPPLEGTNGDGGDDRETVFVQSLQRGLAVIRAFDADNPALTLSDVARATGLARAAARRFLLTLVELGYVRADGRLFRLTPRVLELGRPYLSSLTLPEIALPHMRDLVAETQESATLAVLDGGDIVYVAHVSARRILSVSVSVGERDPAVATSLGRALLASQEDEWLLPFLAGQTLTRRTPQTIVDPQELLAELHRIRAQGYALVDQELEEGLRALSVPIRDARGQVVAAMNVAVHASRWTVEAIGDELLPKLLHTAASIDRDLLATAVTTA
jgi:IclR family pca regulon transcriptional regulator